MTKEERQTKKELMQIVYPNHLKYLKKLKAALKRDPHGIKPKRKTRKNYKIGLFGVFLALPLKQASKMSSPRLPWRPPQDGPKSRPYKYLAHPFPSKVDQSAFLTPTWPPRSPRKPLEGHFAPLGERKTIPRGAKNQSQRGQNIFHFWAPL